MRLSRRVWGNERWRRTRESNPNLDVLTAVEQGVVVTQAALTKRIGISIGLINALLKRAILMGYVKTRQAPYKRYVYYLTPKGFAKKSRLVAEYLDSSLRFFRSARGQYAELMAAAGKAGMTRLVLVGSGELAEIAVLAAWSEDVTSDRRASIRMPTSPTATDSMCCVRSMKRINATRSSLPTPRSRSAPMTQCVLYCRHRGCSRRRS